MFATSVGLHLLFLTSVFIGVGCADVCCHFCNVHDVDPGHMVQVWVTCDV